MSILKKIKEQFRDHRRDVICADLVSMGIDAKMAERGRPEEGWEAGHRISKGLGAYRSLGLIDITGGPIGWLNPGDIPGGQGGPRPYRLIQCGVPDVSLTDGPGAHIRSVSARGFPGFGSVVKVGWVGDDLGRGIIQRLDDDDSLLKSIDQSGDVYIYGIPEHGCWVFMTRGNHAPTKAMWDFYQSIARHLLLED